MKCTNIGLIAFSTNGPVPRTAYLLKRTSLRWFTISTIKKALDVTVRSVLIEEQEQMGTRSDRVSFDPRAHYERATSLRQNFWMSGPLQIRQDSSSDASDFIDHCNKI